MIKAGFQGSLICRLVQEGLGGEKTEAVALFGQITGAEASSPL